MKTTDKAIAKLKLHHIGLLVENIEDSIANYSVLFGKENFSDIMTVNTSKVKLCLIKISEETYLELVQPMGEDSSVYQLLKKKNTYYHMAYKVKVIRNTVDQLEQLNYKHLEYFNSGVFNGKLCIFIYTPEAHLIELIEEE
jgi:methylmalonyl-CoA/ethylmalonyl-CoA epimerase